MNEGQLREFIASDGYPIHFRHWGAKAVRGILLATHGIQSHSGWYQYSSSRFADAGFDVYFADRRGSGLNGRQRGHAAHGLRLINDVRALRQLALAEHPPETPVFLIGLSWGAKTAAAAACLFPDEFQRLVLLYPGIIPRFQLSARQRLKLNLARRLEILRKCIPIPLDDPALFTNTSVWQQFIADDPLALHAVSSSLLNAGRDLDQIIFQQSPELRLPVLLMLAGNDQLIDNQATLTLVSKLRYSQLTIRHWAGATHTLEFEPNREQIFTELIDWLAADS
jgi:acylglycerol lipase